MQGNTNAIMMQGITRNATKIGVKDGQAEDLINLRFMDGSWRASGDGRLIDFTMDRAYQQLYVHTNIYHHLLGVYDGTLYWFAEIGTDGVTFYPLDNTTSRTSWPTDYQSLPTAPVALTQVVGDIWITQTGHLLTIIDENDDFEYFVFKTGDNASYIEVKIDVNGKTTDRKLFPFGQVHFNLFSDENEDYKFSESDENQFIINDSDDINYQDSPACVPKSDESTTHAAAQIWHAQMLKVFNKALEANRFTMPFFAITAIRLYDGSYAYASNPIYLDPREKDMYNPDGAYIHNAIVYDSSEEIPTPIDYDGIKRISDTEDEGLLPTGQPAIAYPKLAKFTSGASTVGALSVSGVYKKNVMESVVRGADLAISFADIDINVLRNNKEVFLGVAFFVTPQSYYFDMSAKGYKDGQVCISSKKVAHYNVGPIISSHISYKPPTRSKSKIIYDLLNSPFFLLREYSLNELEQLQSEIKIDISEPQYEGVLQNLTQQKRLDYESTERTTYLPKVSYMYNGRLHIANYKSYPFFGYPIDYMHLHNHMLTVESNAWFPADQDGQRVLQNLTDTSDFDEAQHEKAQKVVTNYTDLVTTGAPYFLVKVYIDSSKGEQVVCRYIPAYNPSQSVNGRADFIEDLNPLLTYPDARAKKMEIYYVNSYIALNGVYVKWQDFQLKPHPYMNMAYYIDPDLKPIKLADFKNLRETQH